MEVFSSGPVRGHGSDGDLELKVVCGEGHLSVRMDMQTGTPSAVKVTGRADLDADATDLLIRALCDARRRAFGVPPPTASVVEIIERGDRKTDDSTGGLILPNDVRVNGVSVYTTGGVKVHEMDLAAPKEMATVTLTLAVRRITVAADGDL